MKLNTYIKITVVILSIYAILQIFKVLNPKKIAKYCLEDECITVVSQYHRVISGGDSQLRVYKRKVYTRYLLNFGSYAEFPIETHFLLSEQLINNKIVVSSQSLPIIKGNMGDKVVFNKINYYSEGDGENISSFDLHYENF